MLFATPYATYTLLLIITVISVNGFRNHSFFESYVFEVDKILINREYIRTVSSGFLHLGWLHLFFNVFALFSFGAAIELSQGVGPFLLIYFSSLVGGSIFSLIVHRHHGDYSSAGASGAVCGVIFSYLALFPGAPMTLFFLPILIPGWLFGLLFVLISIYGIRSRTQNVGHDAHLGGAIIGMVVALILRPSVIPHNYVTILIVLLPSLIFTWLLIKRPQTLMVNNLFFEEHSKYLTIEDRYNAAKNSRQREIDAILEKISLRGINSLNAKEREKLEKYSK